MAADLRQCETNLAQTRILFFPKNKKLAILRSAHILYAIAGDWLPMNENSEASYRLDTRYIDTPEM